ncbi:MAG: hypothetical protein B6242_13465 [Anaerolineaceae bacterium 4572_78]|nr:MAG: hypothetical protein B6242_13465 [Anaerolineaceae bacterium 4572_78]
MNTLTIELPDDVVEKINKLGLSVSRLESMFLDWLELSLTWLEQIRLSKQESNDRGIENMQQVNYDPLLMADAEDPSLTSFIGKGKGCFATHEEADVFIQAEREAWT